MKRGQIVFIHGGMTFKRYRDYIQYLKTRKIKIKKKQNWNNEYFNKKLSRSFDIIRIMMPCADNSKYNEWKIHFDRYLKFIRKNVILIGYSLGGIFLAKYLSENKFPKKILSTYLVAPPYDNSLPDEDLVGGFRLGSNLSLIEKNSPNLNLLFSKNDKVVPVSQAEKYGKKLKNAKIIFYRGKNGHFGVPEFPEIIKMIQKDFRK